MQIRAPLLVETYIKRLHCGSKNPDLYEPLYTLGSLEGERLEKGIISRLDQVYKDHNPQKNSYYHAIWCEAHMACLVALKRGGVTNMQQIYKKKLQPEISTTLKLICPEAMAIKFDKELIGALCGSSHLKGSSLVCAKLLEKCMSINGNHTESVRYIRAQFTKANECMPKGVAYFLAGCILLGMVRGAPLAPTSLRLNFHLNSSLQIENLVEKLPSRSLWFSLITVVQDACYYHPIFRKTRQKGGFGPKFDVDAVSKIKFDAVKNSIIPFLQGNFSKDANPMAIKRKNAKRKCATEEDFFSGIKHKRRLTENTVLVLFNDLSPEKAKIKLASVYRNILKQAPRTSYIDMSVLQKLNIDNPQGKILYEHATEQRRTLSLIPSGMQVTKPVFALFCLECYTLRTRVRGAASNKATESTILMKDGSHICAACQGKNCVLVDTTNFYITTLLRHIDSVPIVAKDCGMCGYLSLLTNMVGKLPVCAHCFQKYNSKFTYSTYCCICQKMLSKRSHYMPVVTTSNNTLKIDNVCSNCQFIQKIDGAPWNLSPLQKLHRDRETK